MEMARARAALVERIQIGGARGMTLVSARHYGGLEDRCDVFPGEWATPAAAGGGRSGCSGVCGSISGGGRNPVGHATGSLGSRGMTLVSAGMRLGHGSDDNAGSGDCGGGQRQRRWWHRHR